MEENVLEISLRDPAEHGTRASRRMRREGFIPAVFYGDGKEAKSLKLKTKLLEKAISTSRGMNALLKLKSDAKSGLNGKVVMIKDYQVDPVWGGYTHADFIEVNLKDKVEVEVPLHFEGMPVGTVEGGILQQVIRQIHVRSLPMDIPEHISVDVTELNIGQSLHVSDIELPGDAEILDDPILTIVTVVAPAAEEEKPLTEEEAAAAAEAEAEEAAAAEGKEGAEPGAKPAEGEKAEREKKEDKTEKKKDKAEKKKDKAEKKK